MAVSMCWSYKLIMLPHVHEKQYYVHEHYYHKKIVHSKVMQVTLSGFLNEKKSCLIAQG